MRHSKIAGVAGCALVLVPIASAFTDQERQRVVKYWSSPGRYEASLPPAASTIGAWQVRLTPEGSKWLWDYNRARGYTKATPGSVPSPRNGTERAWEGWIEAKIAHDRWIAQVVADASNKRQTAGEEPTEPGDAPKALVALVGEPPNFASAVQPMQHRVTFDDGTVIIFVDNPSMRHRYAYYRSCEGVMSGGTAVKNMPEAELNKLFEKAGATASAQKVMKSVSLLEGGFDSVNTYDTGFVSVGFIQFACLGDGAGSLGAVLRCEKNSAPEAFEKDFRRFGLDVSPSNALMAIDPTTGEECQGAAAAQLIIKDKRLIAVFQRAGRVSEAFKVAQIRTAYEQYYPENDSVLVLHGMRPLAGKVGDIVKSESGLATLMDRKVNTGSIMQLVPVLKGIADANGITEFSQFADYETEIVAAMKYRKNYSADDTLTQPGPVSRPDRGTLPSRHKPRDGVGRGGKKGEAKSGAQDDGSFQRFLESSTLRFRFD